MVLSPVLFYLLFGNAIKMGFFLCHLNFSFSAMVVTFLGKSSILLKVIVLWSVIFIIIVHSGESKAILMLVILLHHLKSSIQSHFHVFVFLS